MRTAEERFWEKVDGSDVEACWVWTGALRTGYGRFLANGRSVSAHRWAYEQLRADVPPGLDLDHLCRSRACVNPWHLDPVTRAVNLRRGQHWASAKTHCKSGHPFDAENTYRDPNGYRECRICRSAADRRRKTRRTHKLAAIRGVNNEAKSSQLEALIA